MLPRTMSPNRKFKRRKKFCVILFEKMVAALSLEEDLPPGETAPEMKDARKKGLPWLIAAFAAVIFVLLLVLVFVVRDHTDSPDGTSSNDTVSSNAHKSVQDLTRGDWLAPSHRSLLAHFQKTAVVSDNGLCSEIGRSILLRGGNAIDTAVATTVCVGALNSHSSGLGGGFLLTFYDRQRKKCSAVDARETAPLATNEETFVERRQDAFTGYKSIAVPGELHGLWTAFKRYGSGKVAWQDLLMPTIVHLRNGYPVTRLMEVNLQSIREEVETEPTMKSFFTNPTTGNLYKEGEILRNIPLAETLHKIAISTDPVKLFYSGEMAQQIAAEIYANEGFLTKPDLERYRSIVDENPVESPKVYGDLSICGPKPPSGFVVVQFIVAVLEKLYPRGSSQEHLFSDAEYYHRLIEAQKYGYAQRTFLADLLFQPNASNVIRKLTDDTVIRETAEKIRESRKSQPEDTYGLQTEQPGRQGTSHVSVIDAAGNAVALTSSINNRFGSRRRSEQLGIIWNDQMDDFSIPGGKNFFGFDPAPSNFIAPGKRPMSSMSPIIVYDKMTGQVKASLGAAGGSKIISALAQVLVHRLSFNQTVKEAIDAPRLHNQFTPIKTDFEEGFPLPMVQALKDKNHNMTKMGFPFATVQAIFRNPDGSLSASNDHRRPVYMNPAGY